MLSDITLGQYFPGSSLLHKLDPRIKIITALFFLVFVFMAESALSFLLLAALTGGLIAMSSIPLKTFGKTIKMLLFILIISFLFNVFSYSDDYTHLLVHFNIGSIEVKIFAEGIEKALCTNLKVVCLVLITSLILTYTTSPIDLTDGIERVLMPIKVIFKVPVHDFAMIMSIALRFIPTLLEQTDKIMAAQSARGADFKTGSLLQRVRALLPVFIPLLISSFRRAIELATAMECRCYHGGDGRTRMKILRMKKRDIIFLVFTLVFCAAIIVSNVFTPNFVTLIYR